MQATKPRLRVALIAALGWITASCNDVQQVVNVPPGGTPGPYTGNIVGRVVPAASGAWVVAAQSAPADSAPADPATGSFAIAGLSPGNYDVVIRAANYRLVILDHVAVYAGSVSYVGTHTLSTTPDPVLSFAPADRSEVVLYSTSSRLAIGIDFAVPMDRASVAAAFTTDPVTQGTFFWSQTPASNPTDHTGSRDSDAAPPGYEDGGSGGELTTFRHIRSLRFIPRLRDTFVDSTYVVTLSPAARDSSGLPMRFRLRYAFRTIQSGITQTQIETQPEDGARNVSLMGASSLRVTFPRRMDRTSVENALTISPATSPIFLWRADNDLLLYTGGPLRAATAYTVNIAAGARDLDGVPLPGPFVFSFETEPVAVRYTFPGNGQVFVDFSTQLRIGVSFNTYIVRSTLAPAWSIVPGAAGQFVWNDNNDVYFQPSAPLAPNTKYTVTLGTAMRDLHGTALPAPYEFAFVTRPE